jgi:outer membrane protein assembly factor BamB
MRIFTCLTLLAIAATAPSDDRPKREPEPNLPDLPIAVSPAGDWPQWLGPHRDGTTAEVVKPWKEPPKVLWHVPIGPGHSSPLFARGLVYLFFQTPGLNEERLVRYVASSGEKYDWSSLDRTPFSSPFGTGPRATPAIAPNGRVIRAGVNGVVDFLKGADDETVYSGFVLDMQKKFHANIPKFGVSASPLIDGRNVIITVGAKNASLIVVDYVTGQVVWRSLDDPASYASPIITEHGGKRQLVALTAEAVVSLDPANGELYWRYPFRDSINESSITPLRVGDMIIASSVTLGSVALKLGTKNDKPTVTEVWKNPALCCYFSTPVAVQDKYVYMVTSSLIAAMTKKPECSLNCVEAATGKVLWTKPKVGKYHAALIRTGDDKLLMHSDTGDLTMIEPDPKEYRELCKAKICGETWAHPALANGRLYVRDNKELICLQLGD